MASLRVPFVLPIQSGPDVFPGVGRVPAVIRITLGLKPDLPTEMLGEAVKAAQQIVDRRRGDFLGYYTQASNAFQAGIVPVMARHWQFDEGMAMYHMSNGLEYLDIIIYPDLASNPDKEKLDFPFEFLEFRLEWSNDDGGEEWQEDYQDSLPNLNEERMLVVHAKIRGPKKIRDDALTIDTSRIMDRYDDDGLPVYFPQKKDPDYSYTVHTFPQSWVGYQMAAGWAMKSDFASQKHTAGDGSAYDGRFYLLAAHPGAGGTPDKKHATSFLVDLRAFDPDAEIDIELRAYWANSSSTDPDPAPDGKDSPFPDVKLTYRLMSGKVSWPPNTTKLIKPLTHWVDYIRRRAQDQLYRPFLSTGQRMGPYRYNRLVGGSAPNGLGGDGWYYDYFRLATWALDQYGPVNIYFAGANGGPRVGEEHFTFDESAHREAEVFTQGYIPTDYNPETGTGDLTNKYDETARQSQNGDARASWPQVNTPGWYINEFELSGAYFWPNDQFDIKPALRDTSPEANFAKFGMYAFCWDDQGFLVLDSIIPGDPPTFVGKNMVNPGDPRNSDGSFVTHWPDGFKVAVYSPQSDTSPLGYTGAWKAFPCTPRQKIVWNTFPADCFKGGSEKTGELKSKQVTDMDENSSSSDKIGTYFGNVKFFRGSVSFSEHGPDPTLD